MRLDKLEIKGFKSFKEKTVLEFPDKFTVIVGPNGSGKSNVIDSICFVLGRSRGLRVTNISELICNGGPGSRECDEAKVTMLLSDGAGKHIKISREIDRTGKSVYRLDDKVSSRQEIIDIMGDNEYNIILQSDINKVIDMKPKERRKIIDDLCGIGEYDSKKEKALGELEKVETRIAEVQIVIGEKQGYLTELGKERDEAVRYQGLQDHLRKGKATILHLEVEEHEKKESKIAEKIDKVRNEKLEGSERIAAIKIEVSSINTKLKGINAEILKLEGDKGATKLLELKSEITRGIDKLENLNTYIENNKSTAAEKKKKKHAFSEEVSHLEAKIKKTAEELAPLAEKIKEESGKVAGFELDKDLDALKTEIFDLKSRITSNTEIRERDSSETESLEKEKALFEEKVKDSLKAEKDLARAIDEHMLKNKSNFQEYERLKTELPVVNRRHSEVSKELEEIQIKYAEKNSELKTLERTSDNLSSSVSAVMNLKAIIPGIYGIASQLGSIANPEYTKALQIAGGARLQSIVVEDEDVAAKCIDYLKKKRIGRATFLPLSRINVKVEKEPPKHSIGFARNFITTPYKFEKIFTYVYGDTVIVKDIDQSKKAGIGGWRMVTLDGDLITKEGAMTGGYIKDVSIKFSSTEELEGEIKSLEKQTIALDGEKQELELKRKKIEEKIGKLEDGVNSGRTDIEKTKLEKEALSSRRSEYTQKITEIDARIEGVKKQIVQKSDESKKLQHDMEQGEKKLEKLLKNAPKTVDTGALDALKEKKHALELEKNRNEEKKSLLASQIKDIETEIESLDKEQKAMEENAKKIREGVKELEEKQKAQEKENSRLMKDIEKLIDDRSGSEEQITKLANESGKLEYEITRMGEEISRQEVEKARIETKLADLKKEYETYAGVELIADKKLKDLMETVSEIEKQLTLFGSVNMRAIESYETLKKEIEEVSEKLETLKSERQSIYDFMETVEQKKRETFMTAFEIIKKNFENIYKDIADGEGTLILDNPREISDCGLLIAASPKGKKLLNMDLMSGGEKVLTTSAFLLAIQRYKPSHFYIVDELDAALDKENSARLAEMLNKTEAQFMMITHNEALMKYAQSVIGVSMTNGTSQVVGVKLKDNN